MSLFFGIILTLIGGGALAVATWLALIGHPAQTPLIGTSIMLGLGLFLIYRWVAKRRARYDY
jgi:hypothetical protein